MTLLIKRLNEKAILPTRGTEKSIGYDLYATEDFIIGELGRDLIPTGIAMQLPPNAYGEIAPRSSLALYEGIQTGAGIIDEDYRGEIKVLLFNLSKEVYYGRKGDKIAQLIIHDITYYPIQEVKDLQETKRGNKGFGSTGK